MTTVWTPEPQPFATWGVESTAGVRRITQDAGFVRVTEQGVIRIIEGNPFRWHIESDPYDPWVVTNPSTRG